MICAAIFRKALSSRAAARNAGKISNLIAVGTGFLRFIEISGFSDADKFAQVLPSLQQFLSVPLQVRHCHLELSVQVFSSSC